jgi:hypothetical protein
MAETRTLDLEWQQFQAVSLAVETPVFQRKLMRSAFYAGAASMLELITGGDAQRATVQQRRRLYETLLDELERYNAEFKRRPDG